jgi:hypothetical protein
LQPQRLIVISGMIRWDKLVLAQSNEVYEDKTSVAILREGRVRNGLESKRKASCYCSKKTKPKIEGRILKLGGFVMLGLVVITITPGDSVAKSRLFGAVLAAAAIALMMFVVALVTILRQGHSLLCSLWLSLRATIFDSVDYNPSGGGTPLTWRVRG